MIVEETIRVSLRTDAGFFFAPYIPLQMSNLDSKSITIIKSRYDVQNDGETVKQVSK